MSDQKFAEFRERALDTVAPVDPDDLLRRGRTLRRNRRLAPVVALAACLAIGFGISTMDDSGDRADRGPVKTPDRPPVISPPDGRGGIAPGSYALDNLPYDGWLDATIEIVGEGWIGWDGGAILRGSAGYISWGFQEFKNTPINRCQPDWPVATRREAVDQVLGARGRITIPPRATTKLGLVGTYLQLRIPADLTCASGATPARGNLMALWDEDRGYRVKVDVWVLEDDDRLLILTSATRGTPTAEMRQSFDESLDSLRLEPRP
ncbi:MAG TPA: hypothetical protein VLI04_06680 [Nocardioidaceae bacterium]|nr:hypothetical protein [Nocardioidaceae bacterium]